MKAIWLFQTTELCGSSTIRQYLLIYLYYECYDFLIYVLPTIEWNYRIWTAGCTGCTNSLKIFLARIGLNEKISRDQITKIYFKPNDELEIKLNRMTCLIWKLLIFIIVLTANAKLRLRRFGTGADIFIPLVYMYTRLWSIML